MAINPLYIPLFNIEEVILDKDTGLPLAAGVVRFYRDAQRLTPKVVYQISGTSPNYTFASVGAVLTLGLSGTFIDQNGDPFVPYAYPYDADGELDLYYVTVESAGGVHQFVRQAVPYVDTGGISPSERTSTENELSNPQFVEVNIPSGVVTTIDVTGSNTVTPVAPGWDIITSGAGTLTLEQLQPTSANVVTNPPFALRIEASSGFGSTITLRQRLSNSPSIFRNGFASGSITAAVLSGGGSFVTMTYEPSTGTSTEIIPSTSIPTDGAYHIIANNAAIPDQGNDPAETGYVDINITLPTGRNIAITSIQVVGTAFSVDIPFDEQTAARQKDHLFHYYEDATVHQSKGDLLVGWNFALNPWQLRSTTLSNVAANIYTADQTIVIQQNYVASATGNNVAVGQGTPFVNFGFGVEAVTANNQFGILQYIDAATIRPYWEQTLSSMVNAFTNSANTIQIKMRLIYIAGLPTATTQTYPVASWTEFGDPVFAAGVTEIIPQNDPVYTLTALSQNFAFEGMVLPVNPDPNSTLGIFLYSYSDNSQNMDIGDHLIINDVSLVQNDFAIRSPCKTFDQVVRECQYYYEKSYELGVLPGTVTPNGIQYQFTYLIQDAGNYSLRRNALNIPFQQIKRAAPTITFYSPTNGAANTIRMEVFDGIVSVASSEQASSTWTQIGITRHNAAYLNNDSTVVLSGIYSLAYVMTTRFHYLADARLGI